jgi:dTDP-4-amino-4,6-dideoxygalactose transaminase
MEVKLLPLLVGSDYYSKELKERAVFPTQAKENEPHYEHREIGYNYRMSNISAGIGRGQMMF